ncbi:polyribonucleotide nucleotidyltransferase 1, mitochondrial [Hylaeus volcanicus]|uniref:polyribonucleotide nucleotidyltransferase 1, mitochondrial n=1 Tax=Hylaeus volcanicus TaxID=313075 RepID=UPI0023B85DE2|nr:polyribonucleotide nucleotidyltransferase 1, mitochondrial [Hylaeus volcanicus]
MVLFMRTGLLNTRNLICLRSTNHCKNGNRLRIRFSSTQFTEHSAEVHFSNGEKMTLSTGKYALFASGNVIATYGNTSVMSTLVRQDVASKSSIVPLTVDYRQKASAIGRIPTNFFRRELGFTETEILIGRIIDRSVRPLFEQGYSHETQLICNLLAVDGLHEPDVLSINAASATLSISDVPWNGPIGAVRVGFIEQECVINPTRRQLQYSTLNLVVACTSRNLVVMLEGSANDILEQDLRKAIRVATKECQIIIQSITDLQKRIGKPKIKVTAETEIPNDMTNTVREFSKHEILNIFTCYSHDKISRDNAIIDLRTKMLNNLVNNNPEAAENATQAFNELVKETFRSLVFDNQTRCDGRKMEELRDIKCQTNLFEPLHGSAFFQRGQTQVLCTVTLDSIENALKMDTVSMIASGIKEKNFFLHYEFPPYATNETGRVTGFARREIGHGALAEKALKAVIPHNYPFAIRLTSEVLQSNGSSSMATVCGGSMALMDAGVPISAPVAGVAIGLICKMNQNTKQIEDYKILTDILGIEDYLGDMDFKIAGTKKGFTAVQADVKVPGIPLKIVMESIYRAHKAKSQILTIMNNVISTPAEYKTNNKPVLETIEVPIHQRAKFLGIGGSNLKKILIETGVNIHWQNDNTYSIFAPNQSAMDDAKEMISKLLTEESEPTLTFGDIYTAKITEIREFGVMVTLYPNMVPTLLPNSQLDRRKIHHPSALGLTVGQEIEVKYFGRDPVNGQIRLSRKVLQEPVSTTRDLITAEESNV